MSSYWNARFEPKRPGDASPTKAPSVGRRRTALLAVLALMMLGTSGCSLVHNGFTAFTGNGSWNETVVVLRNRSFSAKAWHRRKHRFCNERFSSDFCNGFRAGYEESAAGSDGCTPAFPPSEYWSWEYQSEEGHAKTQAWFAGYPQGARAAEEDGIVNWSQVQLSSELQSEYPTDGVLPQQGTLHPIPDPAAQNGIGVIERIAPAIETPPVQVAPNYGDSLIRPGNGTLPLDGPALIIP